MSVAFRIELNGVISPSAVGLVLSCVKLVAVEGAEVGKQVGADRTSLRWLSSLAEQVFSCGVDTGDQWGWVWAEVPSLSPLRCGEGSCSEEHGPAGTVAGCLWLAGCRADLAECGEVVGRP